MVRSNYELKHTAITLTTIADELADDCHILDFIGKDERIEGIVNTYEAFRYREWDYIEQIWNELYEAATDLEDEKLIQQVIWFGDDCKAFLKRG